MAFVYALIVPLWADQLLPQLLMEQFDNLQIQCRHIEHMHEGVNIFFVNFFFNQTPSSICVMCLYCIGKVSNCSIKSRGWS